ncbi:hypothetical protein EJ08DRAFT_702231 [Tothia fuscella]|uniref:Uncharacterized protein n=1 Tax=Tothia fuscella TaxID=1048955 RepID=A0A9P4NGQ0_9PEZI|nr:hypothetical protein EJ08DRAFT_702231 [Tothia fuscella]
MVIGKQTAPVKMHVVVPAMKFGELTFIIGVLGINLVLLLLYCVEAFRTRFWENLPGVDLFDLTGLVKGIFVGSLVVTDSPEDERGFDSSELWVSVLTDTGAENENENGKLLEGSARIS